VPTDAETRATLSALGPASMPPLLRAVPPLLATAGSAGQAASCAAQIAGWRDTGRLQWGQTLERTEPPPSQSELTPPPQVPQERLRVPHPPASGRPTRLNALLAGCQEASKAAEATPAPAPLPSTSSSGDVASKDTDTPAMAAASRPSLAQLAAQGSTDRCASKWGRATCQKVLSQSDGPPKKLNMAELVKQAQDKSRAEAAAEMRAQALSNLTKRLKPEPEPEEQAAPEDTGKRAGLAWKQIGFTAGASAGRSNMNELVQAAQAKDTREAMSKRLSSLKDSLAERISEAREDGQLDPTEVVKKPLNLAKSWFAVARAEHTIISMLYPFDEDFEGSTLTDAQSTQIFWSTLMLELTMLSSMFQPSDPNAPEDNQLNIITNIAEAFLTILPCVVGAIIMRQLFRWGNGGRRFKRVKEPKTNRRSEASQMDSSIMQRKAIDIARGKQESKAKKRRRLLKAFCRTVKFYTGWVLVLLLSAIFLILTMMFAVSFGNNATGEFLEGFGNDLMRMFLMIEPFECAVLAWFPFIFENKYVAQVRTTLKDVGILG